MQPAAELLPKRCKIRPREPEENHAYLHVSIRSCFSREHAYDHAREKEREGREEKEKRLTELTEHEDRKRDARAKGGSSSV